MRKRDHFAQVRPKGLRRERLARGGRRLQLQRFEVIKVQRWRRRRWRQGRLLQLLLLLDGRVQHAAEQRGQPPVPRPKSRQTRRRVHPVVAVRGRRTLGMRDQQLLGRRRRTFEAGGHYAAEVVLIAAAAAAAGFLFDAGVPAHDAIVVLRADQGFYGERLQRRPVSAHFCS